MKILPLWTALPAILGSIALCISCDLGQALAGTTPNGTQSSAAGHPRGRAGFEPFRNEKDAWKLLNDKQVYLQMRRDCRRQPNDLQRPRQ